MRSLIYSVLFYIIVPLWMIVTSPLLLFGTRAMAMDWMYDGLSRFMLWLLERIVGLKVEVRGLDNLPEGAVIVAVKHQSAWDVFGLKPCLGDPAMILKSELMYLPFLGWFARKMQMIPVERGKGRTAIRHLLREARLRVRDKRQIFIFPEGHRMAPGAAPKYKRGVVALYRDLGVPVTPVALNSGLYWPRRSFIRHPGVILVEFLPPIRPGLSADEFMQKLQDSIETASARLAQEALSSPNPPPRPKSLTAGGQGGGG